MLRLAVVLVLGGALSAGGCGGDKDPPSTSEQLRDAMQKFVASVDAAAHVTRCDGPRDGGPGRYVCPVSWSNGGRPLAFTVRVDARGRWRTAELPSAGDASGAENLGSVSGRGLRLP